MKIYFLIIFSLLTIASFSQNNERYIPKDIDAVAMVQFGNLNKEFTAQQLDTLLFFKTLLNSVMNRKVENFSSLKNYGVDMNSNIYWFYKSTDSISYNNLELPITNKQKFITLLNYNDIWDERSQGDKSIFVSKDSSTIIHLDKEKATLVIASLNESYFKNDSLKAASIGYVDSYKYYDKFFPKPSYNTYQDNNTTIIDTAVAIVDSVDYKDEAEVMPSDDTTIVQDYNQVYEDNTYKTNDSLWYAFQDSITLQNKLIFDSIAFNNTVIYLKDLFENRAENSLLENVEFQSKKRNNDLVYFYFNHRKKYFNINDRLNGLYTNKYAPYNSFNYLNNAFSGAWLGLDMYKGIDAHLYTEKKSLKLEIQSHLIPEILDGYSKILQSTLNKKFYQYIDGDHTMGSISFAYNMEAYLHFFPKFLGSIMGMYSKSYGKDYGEFASDFISLILDEKAIAKAYKGDGLFLVDGLTSNKVSYTDYTYDSSYNYTPVQKIKTEYIPNFLSMFSSDDPSLIEKGLGILVKRKNVQFENGIYSFKIDSTISKSFKYTIGLLIKDGIIFLGSDLHKLTLIQQGNYKFKINKELKKFYAENNLTLNFSSMNVFNALSGVATDMDSTDLKIKNILPKLGNFKVNSKKTNDGIETIFNYETNEDGKNPLVNILDFMNMFLHETAKDNY